MSFNLIEGIIIFFILFGFSFVFWGLIGLLRLLDDVWFKKFFSRFSKPNKKVKRSSIKVNQVAVIVPAYNEELVIDETIKSLLPLVPAENIFVNTFGSSDKTAEIASQRGVNVLNAESDGKAKAEKLSQTIKKIKKDKKYKAVLFVDADTRISPNFLVRALPHFEDPETVAFAGYATTLRERKNTPFWGMFFVSYRERVYFFMQNIYKYAQTWRIVNVSPIIPGFASIYRMEVLPKIDIDPKGLVIEDFNMTFEVHHKKLGKIAHHQSVFAKTQDPDNLRDYIRQVSRWDLGFWQTVRRHGFWPSAFSFFLLFYIVDMLIGSIIFILIPLILLVNIIPHIFPVLLFFDWFQALYHLINPFFSIKNLFFGVFVLDYIMTVILAYSQKRIEYFLFGFGFLFLRYIDSVLFILMLPKAYMTESSGRWKSPTRR